MSNEPTKSALPSDPTKTRLSAKIVNLPVPFPTGPLVGPEVDIRTLPNMMLDMDIIDRKTIIKSSLEEIGAAFLLWRASWREVPAASLPDDDDELADLIGRDMASWLAVKDAALRGFVKCSDGRLYHPVIAQRANDAWKGKQGFRERMQDAANKRWADKQRRRKTAVVNDESADDPHKPLETNENIADAKYKDKCKSNYKKESKKREREAAEPSSASPAPDCLSRGKAGDRPRKVTLEAAIKAGMLDQKKMGADAERIIDRDDIPSEFEKFRDYHLAKATTSADWGANWRSWCAKCGQFQ